MDKDIIKFDVDFTFKDIEFNKTESIVRDFLDKYNTIIVKEHESNEDGVHQIPVSGVWDMKPRYMTFIIGSNKERLYLRIWKPINIFGGVYLEDCIAHRDNLADGFIDYLISEDIDIL